MRNADAIKSYSRLGKKAVEGWFHRIDTEIFSTLLSCQEMNGIVGGCSEIGVHHGKSFIPLCLSLKANELALCIDIFEERTRNLDVSGRGDRENLARFGIDLSSVRVFAESSENITAERILKEVGPVRFFSIDRGHWKAIVVNDLTLAERSLSRGGIIALDDSFRTD